MIAALVLHAPLLLQTSAAASTQDAARADAIVQKTMHGEGAVGISVAVLRGNEMVYSKAYGFVDLEFAVSADEETMFRIGSVTKQFTAAGILKLAERGKLSVDDPLTKFLPDYPTHGHEITLRHLLTHTSGVHNYTDLGPKWEAVQPWELSDDELVALWQDLPLDFAPGERWNYSNSGYYLLGMVIAKVSGSSYADFLRETFFEPLKLTRTRYDSNGEVILNRAQGYSFGDGKFWNDRFVGMSQPGAAGALISTASDLVRWQQALVTGQVVQPESYLEMTTPFMLDSGRETGYGMGLQLDTQAGEECVWHGGGIHGFNSVLLYFPGAKLSVGVISNSQSLRADALGVELAKALLATK
ncbi:MAG: beta-lactamase family protein [Planctomycetes bacterium]|nr:beta-lactamase family protein [Planctomycetota bacterium]